MTAEEPELRPGEILSGTYEIVRRIARGGMGTVYEARHRRLQARRVAIKLLRSETSLSQREVARRFRREAEICSELAHPNIISVTDWDTASNGQPFFVMELLEGEGLDWRMARGRLPLPLALRILAQTGSALQYAHDRSIVHRDLKPSNIFLVSTGVDRDQASFVKVLDFGISKILTASTLETTESKIIGSPRYMSPEQARGDNEELTPSSDQFGLATVAYEMLAGQAAFSGDTLSTVLFNIVYEQPEPLAELAADLPPAIVSAVNKAMSKDPADRYPCVADFIRDLADAGREAGALSGDLADTLISRSGARPRGRRRWLWAAPLVALVAIPVAVFVEWTHDPAVDADLPSRVAATEGGAEGSAGAVADTAGEPTEFRAAADTAPGATTARPSRPGAAAETPGRSAVPENAVPAERPGPPAKADPPGRSAVPENAVPPGRLAPPANTELPPPSAGVQNKLDEAQKLLDRGQYERAIREANRTIGKQETAQARRIVTLAYCGLGHLEMAKASFRKVWRADRSMISAQCKKRGLEL